MTSITNESTYVTHKIYRPLPSLTFSICCNGPRNVRYPSQLPDPNFDFNPVNLRLASAHTTPTPLLASAHPLPLPLPPPLASRLPPLYLRRPPAPPIPLHPAGSGAARAVCRRIWGRLAWGSEPPSDLGSAGLGRRRLALGREGDGEQAAMPLAERGKGSRPPGPWPRG